MDDAGAQRGEARRAARADWAGGGVRPRGRGAAGPELAPREADAAGLDRGRRAARRCLRSHGSAHGRESRARCRLSDPRRLHNFPELGLAGGDVLPDGRWLVTGGGSYNFALMPAIIQPYAIYVTI